MLLGWAYSDLETSVGVVFHDVLDDCLAGAVGDGFLDWQKFVILLEKRLWLELQKSLVSLKGVKVKDIGLFDTFIWVFAFGRLVKKWVFSDFNAKIWIGIGFKLWEDEQFRVVNLVVFTRDEFCHGFVVVLQNYFFDYWKYFGLFFKVCIQLLLGCFLLLNHFIFSFLPLYSGYYDFFNSFIALCDQ